MWIAVALVGLLAVLTTALPWHDAVSTTQTAAPVLAFLVAMTVLAGLTDAAGLFELAARGTARLARGSTAALFLIVCALLTLVTLTLSLDTTAVLMTPVVLALADAVGVAALPFALATVWLANAASLLLPISNLTNLLATSSAGAVGRGDFVRRMALPEGAAVAIVIVTLGTLFRSSLRGRHPAPAPFTPADRLLVATAGVCCLAIAPCALLGIAPWKVAVPAAAVLSGVFGWRRRAALHPGLVPWRLVILTEGLFLIVAALGRHGLDRLLTQAAGHSPWRTELVGAGLANAVNNLPAYLAVSRVIPAGHSTQRLALLLGTNAGPMLLLSGSLATLLWRERCRARGLEVSAGQFLRYGLVVVPLLLLGCYGALLVTPVR